MPCDDSLPRRLVCTTTMDNKTRSTEGSDATRKPDDEAGQAKRGQGFARIIGQNETIQRIRAFVDLHRSRGKPIGHILLVGALGSGKRTIAQALAHQYDLDLRETTAGAVDTRVGLAGTMSGLDSG